MATSNSKLSEKFGKSINKAAATEMTFMTGNDPNDREANTSTQQIYMRIMAERHEESEHKKMKAAKAMQSEAFTVSQYQNQSH